MSPSVSTPKNTTSTTTNASETNVNTTGGSGITLGTCNQLNIQECSVTTCADATEAADELGMTALSSNAAAVQSANGVSLKAIQLSCNVASEALDALTETQSSSTALVQQTTNNALASASCALNTVAQASSSSAAAIKLVEVLVIGVGVILVAYFVFKPGSNA